MNNIKKNTRTILIMATLCLAASSCDYVKIKDYHTTKDESGPFKTVWTYKSGIGQITTKIFENDGLIFAGSESGEMYCISKETKELVWKKEKYPDFTWLDFHQGKIFFGSSDFKVYCLDQKTGDIVWLHCLDEGFFSKASFMADFIYFGTSGNNLYCLDILTGEQVWKFPVKAQIIARPVISQGYVVFGTLDGTFYCCNGITGKLIWSAIFDEPIRNDPATLNKNIYIAAGKKLHCLDNQQGKILWTKINESMMLNSVEVFNSFVFYQTHKKLVCLKSDGGLVWEIEPAKDNMSFGNFDCEELIVDENGIIVVNPSKLSSFDVGTGKLQWDCRYSTYKSSYPVNSNNALYFLASESVIKCLSTLTGKSIWDMRLSTYFNNIWKIGKGKIIASTEITVYPPDFAEGADSYAEYTLYCFDSKQGNILWTVGGFREITVINENIFVMKDENTIINMNPDTGLQKWEFEAANQINWDIKSEENLLYLVTEGVETGNAIKPKNMTMLYCIDINSGKILWERETLESISRRWYLSNSKIFFTYSNGIVCMDAKENKTLWMYEVPIKTRCFFTSLKDKLFVGLPRMMDYDTWVEYDGSFLCIEITSGKLLWQTLSSCESEIVAESSIVSFATEGMYAFRDATKGTVLFEMKLEADESVFADNIRLTGKGFIIKRKGNIESFDLASGQKNWSCKDFENTNINVFYLGNWAIVINYSGLLSILNLETGIVEAEKDINLDILSSVLIQDEFLYLPDQEGLTCLSVDYRNLKRIIPSASFQAENPIMTVNGVGIEMDSTPIMLEETMYVEPEYFEKAFRFSFRQDGKLRTLVISNGYKRAVMTRGLNRATIDGEDISIDKGLIIANGKILLPVKTVCNLFGGKVSFDPKNKVSFIEWNH